MSQDVVNAVFSDVRTKLAAITPQVAPLPPVSPIVWTSESATNRLYTVRKPNPAPVPCAFIRSESTASGRSALGVEFDAFLSFDAWCRNREEVEAVRKAVLFLHGHSVGNQGTAYRIVYRLNSQNVITEPDALHLSMLWVCNFLEDVTG